MEETVKKVAITGGIGSGKSYAMKVIKSLGYPTFSCDKINGELYKDRSFLEKLKTVFPYAVRGKLFMRADKKLIAKAVFSNPDLLTKLNDLSHPEIISKALTLMENCGQEKAFLEVPLLFECGYQDLFDEVIVIKRDLQQRIESVKTRSKLTEEEIKERIANQFDYEQDLTKYKVVENDGDFAKKIADVLKEI